MTGYNDSSLESQLVIKSGAKLKLNNVASGNTYRIADKFAGGVYKDAVSSVNNTITVQSDNKYSSDTPLEGWNGNSLVSDTSLLLDAATMVDEQGDGIIVKVTNAAPLA